MLTYQMILSSLTALLIHLIALTLATGSPTDSGYWHTFRKPMSMVPAFRCVVGLSKMFRLTVSVGNSKIRFMCWCKSEQCVEAEKRGTKG